MAEILLFAFLAGMLLVSACAPLGSLVVWRRMAYFGDALAHGALFGVALGLALGWMPSLSVVLACLGLALLLTWLERDARLPVDALLGMLSTGGLAAGIVFYSLAGAPQGDLFAYLFGDVLAVGLHDLVLMAAAAIVVLWWVKTHWAGLLLWVLNEDMAAVEGVNVRQLRLHTTLLLALVIALAIKMAGVLLVTAMLVIPPLVGRKLARTPLQMIVCAWMAGIIAVAFGLWLSLHMNIPAGPAMVLVALLEFIPASLLAKPSAR